MRTSRFRLSTRVAYVLVATTGLFLGTFANGQTPPVSSTKVADLVKAFNAETVFWKAGDIAEELVKRQDRRVIPEIAPLLASDDGMTRCNAAWVLAGLGDDRGLPAIVGVLRKTRPDSGDQLTLRRYAQERYYAVHVLSRLRDKRAVPVLLEYINDGHLDYEVAYALGRIGDPQAIPPLKAALARWDDGSMHDRYVLAAGALMELGVPEGLAVIDRILGDKAADWLVRRRAVQSLVRCPSQGAAFDRLAAMLDDACPDLREAAIYELAKLGDKRAIPRLEHLLNDTALCTHGIPLEGRSAADFKTVSEAAAKAIETLRHVQNDGTEKQSK